MSHSKRKRDKSNKSFVMLPRRMLRDQEWKGLSPAAKILYVHLKGKYNGHNNGAIRLYYSELKGVRGISSPNTASRAFRELEKKGWIKRTKLGGVYRRINEYELTGKHDVYLK
jgi:DNA-binding MarR family transcriptional regulator